MLIESFPMDVISAMVSNNQIEIKLNEIQFVNLRMSILNYV